MLNEECDDKWEGSLENETFCENLIRMGLDSCDDEDWVPFRLQWLKNKRKEKKRVVFLFASLFVLIAEALVKLI